MRVPAVNSLLPRAGMVPLQRFGPGHHSIPGLNFHKADH